MGKKLPPDQLELYKRIDEILFYKWDPIGISESAWSRDEYQSYLPTVFGLALKNERPEPLAEYLTQIATGSMGSMLPLSMISKSLNKYWPDARTARRLCQRWAL